MTRIAAVLLLALLAGAAGCKKAGTAGTGSGGGGGNGGDGGGDPFRFRPKGGSTTLPGQIRDRALDTVIADEMRQAATAITAEDPTSPRSPADKAGWLKLLQGYRTLRALVESGEVVTFQNVNLLKQPDGGASTVLMYEKRVVDYGDGIVLTCDGKAARMNKAQFEALAQPK
jgi:hypothetical protein